MLHLHNGESTAYTLKEFGFPGEHFAFKEVLMAGPAPNDLTPNEWIELRAKFLSEKYELNLEDCKNDFLKQDAVLQSFSEHDETVLWFEHDLFCQINLIYLLDWFSKQSLEKYRLSLICICEFPGVKDFRGLGQLTGEQLASLFEGRREVTAQALSLAGRAWSAYRSANPEAIELLLEEGTQSMPFLEAALRLHLARFPSIRNGLGRIENKALELIADGAANFKSLFVRFGAAEPVYGLGDSQLWCELKRLAKCKEPLIDVSDLSDGDRFHNASFVLTDLGRAVLAGERDFVETNGIDLWLGGVHLENWRALWRWDSQNAKLVRTNG